MVTQTSQKPGPVKSHDARKTAAKNAGKKARASRDDDEGPYTVEIAWPPAAATSATPDPEFPVVLRGRPAWTAEATSIVLDRMTDRSYLEDRRHIVHWSEHLRPYLESVFGDLVLTYRTRAQVLAKLTRAIDDFNTAHQGSLPKPQWLKPQKATRASVDKLMLFIGTRMNSVVRNLVPDRADINQAIENVRKDLRRYMAELDKQARKDFEAGNLPADAQQMNVYIEKAEEVFEVKLPENQRDQNMTRVYQRADLNSNTDRRSEINSVILRHMRDCRSPSELISQLHALIYSVTFDLSQKAKRDQTARAFEWLDTMKRNEEANADQRLDDLLSFFVS